MAHELRYPSERKNVSTHEEWPFEGPKNLAVITTTGIVHGEKPILLVSHDTEDGGWQFLGGTAPDEAGAAVVGLLEITQKDPTVLVLADLPPGWHAWRENVHAPWSRGIGSSGPSVADHT